MTTRSTWDQASIGQNLPNQWVEHVIWWKICLLSYGFKAMPSIGGLKLLGALKWHSKVSGSLATIFTVPHFLG